MRELSLHILDLVENAISAGATRIEVSVDEQPESDLLSISVEDNGTGLSVSPQTAIDPFFTTKEGKKTGLGLSLFRHRVEQAGGEMKLERSPMGGLAVRAVMKLAHVDRSPLGDLGATLASVVCCNPGLELCSRLRVGERKIEVSSVEIARGIPAADRSEIVVARLVRQSIEEGLSALHVTELSKGKENSMNEVPVGTACTERATDAELLKRLDGVLAEYRGKPGALIPVLQIAQGIFGFLPEKVLKRVALSLGKSYSEVAGVVGFYSFFSTVPRGKHLIRVCLGTACYVRGGKLLLETFKQELGIEVGGTTADGFFSLEVARCFGACGLAPTVMIDEDVLQRVKPLKVRGILEAYRLGKSAGVEPQDGRRLPKGDAGSPRPRGGKGSGGNGAAKKAKAPSKKTASGRKQAAAKKAAPARKPGAKKAGVKKAAKGRKG